MSDTSQINQSLFNAILKYLQERHPLWIGRSEIGAICYSLGYRENEVSLMIETMIHPSYFSPGFCIKCSEGILEHEIDHDIKEMAYRYNAEPKTEPSKETKVEIRIPAVSAAPA